MDDPKSTCMVQNIPSLYLNDRISSKSLGKSSTSAWRTIGIKMKAKRAISGLRTLTLDLIYTRGSRRRIAILWTGSVCLTCEQPHTELGHQWNRQKLVLMALRDTAHTVSVVD